MPTSSKTRLDTFALDRLIKDLPGLTSDVVARVAFTVEGKAKIKAPVDTGALRASIYTSMRRSSRASEAMAAARARRPEAGVGALPTPHDDFTAHVGPSVEYGEQVELGTSRRPGTPYLQPALRESEDEMRRQWKAGLRVRNG